VFFDDLAKYAFFYQITKTQKIKEWHFSWQCIDEN